MATTITADTLRSGDLIRIDWSSGVLVGELRPGTDGDLDVHLFTGYGAEIAPERYRSFHPTDVVRLHARDVAPGGLAR